MNASDSTINACKQLILSQRLPADFLQVVIDIYLPLAEKLMRKIPDHPVMISINGAQGTGKSTLTSFLQLIIESELQVPVAAVSLDDFYATFEQRQKLAKEIHPLLATRGVPGTHDLELMDEALGQLLLGRPAEVPQFDKAIDDRRAREQWSKYEKPVKAILFEGWCNHSPHQAPDELSEPINELETNEDPDGTWRHYANDQLIQYHQRIFSRADMCIMLKSPDFEHVYQWRLLQEQKLKQTTAENQSHRLMDEATLIRFIQHYERITRHTLKHLPNTANIVLPIRPDHSIEGIMEKHAR